MPEWAQRPDPRNHASLFDYEHLPWLSKYDENVREDYAYLLEEAKKMIRDAVQCREVAAIIESIHTQHDHKAASTLWRERLAVIDRFISRYTFIKGWVEGNLIGNTSVKGLGREQLKDAIIAEKSRVAAEQAYIRMAGVPLPEGKKPL